MNFKESILNGLSNYVTWQGRASRSEFWFWELFWFLAAIAAMILDAAFKTNFTLSDGFGGETNLGYGYFYLLVALSLLLPSISMMVRRLHDHNKSGGWIWLFLIPLVGGIIMLVWFCQRGTIGDNDYGPDPLA